MKRKLMVKHSTNFNKTNNLSPQTTEHEKPWHVMLEIQVIYWCHKWLFFYNQSLTLCCPLYRIKWQNRNNIVIYFLTIEKSQIMPLNSTFSDKTLEIKRQLICNGLIKMNNIRKLFLFTTKGKEIIIYYIFC